jgi:hypothetical protein
MASGVYSTQGKTLMYRTESALGTGSGTLQNLRFTEGTFPTDSRILVANPNGGHAHSFNVDDHGIPIEMYREGALSFTTEIRGPATPGNKPPIVTLMESAGCTATAMGGDTTVAGTPAVDTVELTDDYGGFGLACAVELAGSKYFPILAADYSASTITPTMDLPSAPSASNTVANMYCVIPSTGALAATDTIELVANTRGTQSSGQDLSFRYNAVSCSGIGELSFKYGEAPKMSFTFNVGKLTEESDAIAEETFYDSAKMCVIDDNFEAAYATYDMGGGITRNVFHLLECTFVWGFKVIPIMASGGGSVAGLQGYIQVADPNPKITITGLYDSSWQSLLQDENDSYKYFHFVQPCVYDEGNESAFGLWLPKCRLSTEAPVTHDFVGGEYIKSTTTWDVTTEAFTNSGTTIDSNSAAAPWYFGVLHGTMA